MERDATRPQYIEQAMTAALGVSRAARETRKDVAGIVLAGGHGWDPAARYGAMCIPMLPVAGQPLVLHVVDWLHGAGIEEVSLCANSHTALISDFLSSPSIGTALKYYTDRMPRGPAGCAHDVAIAAGADLFVVAEGAIVPEIDLETVLDTHARSEAVATVVAYSAPGSDLHALQPAGVYVFSKTALQHVPRAGFQDIKEMLLPKLSALGETIETHRVHEQATPRVSDLTSYLAVNMWAVGRLFRSRAIPAGYTRVQSALVHRSARVASSARFVGPVLIGPGTIVGDETTTIGPTSIGARCTIERGAVVSRTAIWDACRVAAGSVVDRCVLMHGTVIEPALVARHTAFAGSSGNHALESAEPFPAAGAPKRETVFDRFRRRASSLAGDG